MRRKKKKIIMILTWAEKKWFSQKKSSQNSRVPNHHVPKMEKQKLVLIQFAYTQILRRFWLIFGETRWWRSCQMWVYKVSLPKSWPLALWWTFSSRRIEHFIINSSEEENFFVPYFRKFLRLNHPWKKTRHKHVKGEYLNCAALWGISYSMQMAPISLGDRLKSPKNAWMLTLQSHTERKTIVQQLWRSGQSTNSNN